MSCQPVRFPGCGIWGLLAAVIAGAGGARADEAPQADRTFGGQAQVTAVEVILDVRDRDGEVPATLRPEDFLVTEDGEPQRVILVEKFARGETSGLASASSSTPERQARDAVAPTSAWQWQMVVYVDEVLSSPRSIRRAATALAQQAGYLTELGTVEIYSARPTVHQLLAPTRSARLVEQALEGLAKEAPGRDSLRQIRRQFLDYMRLLGELDGTGAPVVDKARGPVAGPVQGGVRYDGANFSRRSLVLSSVREELTLLGRQHDALMTWLGGRPSQGPQALLLINDGYDMNPRDFYVTGVATDSNFFEEVGAELVGHDVGPTVEQISKLLSARGWVTFNLALGSVDSMSTHEAEHQGKGRLGGLVIADEQSVTELPNASIVQPLGPLRLYAHATGGDTLTGVSRLPKSLGSLGERVRLTYQVARPPDARIRRVEVEARNPGWKVRSQRWTGTPTIEQVASARMRRLLADDPERGELPVVAAVAFASEATDEGTRTGRLQARVELAPIKASLATVATTDLRVSVGARLADGQELVRHDVVAGQALADLDVWTYAAPLELPASVERVAISIEDLTSGGWGGALSNLVVGELPEAVSAAGVPLERQDLPLDPGLLPDPKAILLAAPPEVLIGKVRLEPIVDHPGVERVVWRLDGKSVAERVRSPFEARIDFGNLPEPHTVEAIAFDASGLELGRDSIAVNQGVGTFGVRIIEPRPGRKVGSVDVEADVRVPEGELDRVEVRWNDRLVGTLFDPPFRHRIQVPREAPVGYLAVVAHRRDGSRAEDVVVLNDQGTFDEVLVDVVELVTVVTDAERKPVRGLAREQFRVLEAGTPMPIEQLGDGSELALHLGLVLDSSASMHESMRAVQTAAIDFLMIALEERDRGFVVDFDSEARLVQPMTDDRRALASAIASLSPGGYSALCDALVFSLVQMRQIKGRRALVVLTDGVGREERVSFHACQRYVQQSGIPVYVILMGEEATQPGAGGVTAVDRVRRLTASVGGQTFHIAGAESLGPVYRQILTELRSQYLLTYVPGALGEEGEWRPVRVEVDAPDLTARTISGYYWY